MSEILTKEQVQNWRQVLLGMIGPYALLMPDEQVQAFRDRFQSKVDDLGPSQASD